MHIRLIATIVPRRVLVHRRPLHTLCDIGCDMSMIWINRESADKESGRICLGALLKSGRPREPGKSFNDEAGGPRPYILEGPPGLEGPVRFQKCTQTNPARGAGQISQELSLQTVTEGGRRAAEPGTQGSGISRATPSLCSGLPPPRVPGSSGLLPFVWPPARRADG